MSGMTQELEGVQSEQVLPVALGGSGLWLDGGQPVGEGSGQEPCTGGNESGEGGSVGMQPETDEQTGCNPAEGTPDAEGAELAAGTGKACEDDHAGQPPDRSGAELLELEKGEDDAAVPAELDGQKGQKEQDARAHAQVTKQARGGEMAVGHGAGNNRRDKRGDGCGGQGVRGKPLQSVGLEDGGEGDKPEGDGVR